MPKRTRCDQPVRGSDVPCELEQGHSGYHSTATYECEGCGKVKRCPPYETAPDAPDSPRDAMKFCFICGDGPARVKGKVWW